MSDANGGTKFVTTVELGISAAFGNQKNPVPTEQQAKELKESWDATWKSVWEVASDGKKRTISEEEYIMMKAALLTGVVKVEQ
jgi:hypothetical protein